MRQPATRVPKATTPPRLPMKGNESRLREILAGLPEQDNAPDALRRLLEANRELRHLEWPEPLSHTSHTIRIGDSRTLDWLTDASVDLVVTSPPYWTLKDYNDHPKQLGAI